MKKNVLLIVYLALSSVLMIIGLSSCANNNENIEAYQAIKLELRGMAIEPSEVSAEGISLALSDNGSCVLTMDGEDYHADWQEHDGQFTLSQGSDSFSGICEGDTITLLDTLGMGLDITFLKEGAIAPAIEGSSNDEIKQPNEPSNEHPNEPPADFVGPGFGTEQTILANSLTAPSDWYGLLLITDYSGEHNISGEYEAWGYIDSDADGDYFELYVDAPFDDNDAIVFMSFNIDLDEHLFEPIVDDMAWLYGDASLKAEDSKAFKASLNEGILSAQYQYSFNNQAFTLSYRLSQINYEE